MRSLAEEMDNWRPTAQTSAGRMARSLGVGESAEFWRIYNLPRRERPKDISALLNRVYRTPGGTMELRYLQAAALTELHDFRGAAAPIPAGEGKTLPSLLAPTVLEAERSVLFVKAKLRDKAIQYDIPFYQQHFRFKYVPIVVSYETLSSPKNARLLWEIQPTLVICDEVHALKDEKSIRWKRFRRYFDEFPDTVLFALSASFTERSIMDYWHILKLTHKERSPVPTTFHRAREWADATDADIDPEKRVPPGALERFCAPGESVRDGLRRRIVETPGIISSTDSHLSRLPGLEIYEVDPGEPPAEIRSAFEGLRSTWETPGGETVDSATTCFLHATTLALGYYTRWVWPGGEPDLEWIEARKNWHKWVREWIQYTGSRHAIDEEWRVAGMCEKGELSSPYWEPWAAIKDRYGREGPPRETIWISDWIINHAAEYAARIEKDRESGPLLVWVRSPRIGEPLAAKMGVPYFGAGDSRILSYDGTCVASMLVHGEGVNLQDRFHTNILVGTPYGGTQWEQLLARTHRFGQRADTVTFHVYLHCREMRNALQRSENRAIYAAETLLGEQRLQRATIIYKRSNDDVYGLEMAGHPLWKGNKP